MSNTPLPLPPSNLDFLDKDGKMTNPWNQWFNDLHLKIATNRNQQNLTAAGAVNLDSSYVSLNSTTAGFAITLAAPTLPGLTKTIEMVTHGGGKDVTMALTNVTGAPASSSCKWNGTNQQLILMSNGLKWVYIGKNGVTIT